MENDIRIKKTVDQVFCNSNYRTLAINGAMFGDESKGRLTDLFTTYGDCDVVVRYNGGPNAGHTITIYDKKYKVRALPSGCIVKKGSSVKVPINIIADGCVVDLIELWDEVNKIWEDNELERPIIKISTRAHVITPFDKEIDQFIEENRNAEVKTTGNGIGPSYAEKAFRTGLRVGDFFYGTNHVKEIVSGTMSCKTLNSLNKKIDEAVVNMFEAFKNLGYVVDFVDTSAILQEAIITNKRILFEGAQSSWLDITNGIYPFVTSSNSTVCGIPSGCGIPPKYIDNSIGVVKAYNTRVGAGPFITEIDDESIATKIRETGNEYGTVTGRPRRIGWFDIPLLIRSAKINGYDYLYIGLLDVLTGVDEIKLCYDYDGTEFVPDTKKATEFPSVVDGYNVLRPKYKVFKGWCGDISNCRKFEDLPLNTQKYIEAIEEYSGIKVAFIGVGPNREQIICKDITK